MDPACLAAQEDLYKDANSALDKVIQISLIAVQALFVHFILKSFIMKPICENKGIMMVPATSRQRSSIVMQTPPPTNVSLIKTQCMGTEIL